MGALFKGKSLGEITRQDVEAFITHLETLPEKAKKEQAEIDRALQEESEKEKAEIKAGLRKAKRKNAAPQVRRIVRFPKSAKRKNAIIQAGTIPLAWAFQKEIIEKDITAGIVWFSGKSKERQILTPELARALFEAVWKDDRSRIQHEQLCILGREIP